VDRGVLEEGIWGVMWIKVCYWHVYGDIINKQILFLKGGRKKEYNRGDELAQNTLYAYMGFSHDTCLYY
jgi:hypothetical protein